MIGSRFSPISSGNWCPHWVVFCPSREAENGQKQSLTVQEIRSDSPPAVANMLNRLIAENYGFQNELAGVTSGTVTELLAYKFGMSPERAAALVVAVRLSVAAFNAAKGGGGAKGTGGTTVDRSGPTVAQPSKLGSPASQADGDFGYLNQPGPSKPPAFFDAQASAKGFINNGRINAADLQKLVPPGKPDLFKPSATFTDGSKFQYTLNG